MIEHQEFESFQPLGHPQSIIMVRVQHWGMGAMLEAVASWLPIVPLPAYVFLDNYHYHARERDQLNKFEWFFNQPGLKNGESYKIFQDRNNDLLPTNGRHSPETITAIRDLIRRHWSLRPELLRLVRDQTPDLSDSVGVHYRGTDKFIEVQPTPIPVVIEMAERARERLGVKTIVLATDDHRVADKFAGTSNVWIFDHLRGDGDIGIHHSNGSRRQATEVMVEMLAIGMCKHAIVGRSCVGDMMLMMARNKNLTWEYHGS